jgi:hypothetical protein
LVGGKMIVETEDRGFFFPPKSAVCTRTFFLFLSDYKRSVETFFFTLNLAHRADDASVSAAKALIAFYQENDEKRKQLQETIDSAGRMARKLSEFSGINSKNIAANSAEAFLWYVSNIIQSAIRKRPEMMKSNETIRIEEVLNFSTRRELVNYLIDRKINSLSYGGLKQIEKYFDETLGVALFEDDRTRMLLRVFIEIRNIQAHNRGYINSLFLERVGSSLAELDLKFTEGEKAHLDFDKLCQFTRACVETALLVDNSVAKKFRLQTKKIETWLKENRQIG